MGLWKGSPFFWVTLYMVKNMCFHHTEIGLRHLLATGFGMFVLVYTGRCAGVELPPIDADSLRAHLRFGLVPCDWQHSFTSTITGGRICFMHQCVFLYVLHREDQSMHFTRKVRTILAFPHEDRSANKALCFYVFSPRMPNLSEISISFYNNREHSWEILLRKCRSARVIPSPFSTSLFACVLTFSIYLWELFTELWLKLNTTVSC